MFLIGSKVSNRLISSDICDEDKDKTPFVLFVERLFKLRERNTTLSREIKCGFLHFVSAAFILSVNSRLLSENASYSATKVAANSALSTGVSCILCGFFSNLPFILSPTTSTSIYFALYIQNHNLSIQEGNLVVFLLGILFCLCGIRPIALFITNIIPFVMKVGVCLGVALLIALEAMVEIGLVQTGEHTVLDIGNFTPEIYIAMGAFIVIGLALHYRIRGAFLIGLSFGALFNWISMIIQNKHITWSASDIFVDGADMTARFSDISFSSIKENTVYRLVFDLYVIGVILLNGLAHGLADTAGLKREDSTLPRGKWLYASCGLGTMLSAFISSGPIMISPESAPGNIFLLFILYLYYFINLLITTRHKSWCKNRFISCCMWFIIFISCAI
jgi:AGZA family xanthine/uracil permease-like MFS transporter